jgi:hypothetical protein
MMVDPLEKESCQTANNHQNNNYNINNKLNDSNEFGRDNQSMGKTKS